MENSTNITYIPPFNSTDDNTDLHENIWLAVRIVMGIGIFSLILTLCYLRSKYKQVEEGNLGSLDSRHYMDMYKEKRNVIHSSGKIYEIESDGALKEIELTQARKEDGTYFI